MNAADVEHLYRLFRVDSRFIVRIMIGRWDFEFDMVLISAHWERSIRSGYRGSIELSYKTRDAEELVRIIRCDIKKLVIDNGVLVISEFERR